MAGTEAGAEGGAGAGTVTLRCCSFQSAACGGAIDGAHGAGHLAPAMVWDEMDWLPLSVERSVPDIHREEEKRTRGEQGEQEEEEEEKEQEKKKQKRRRREEKRRDKGENKGTWKHLF